MEKKRKSNSKGKGKEKRDWAARLLVDTIPELLPALLLAETLQRETERVSYEQLVVLLGRSDVDDHHAVGRGEEVFKTRTNERTNERTNGRTDGRTDPTRLHEIML